MALPKAEGPLYLSKTGVSVQTARPGRRSRAGVVGPGSVRGATCGVSLDAERVRDKERETGGKEFGGSRGCGCRDGFYQCD